MGTRTKTNSRLYDALNQGMSQPTDWLHLCHLKTCIWMIVALIHTGSVNLTKWSQQRQWRIGGDCQQRTDYTSDFCRVRITF